MAMPMAKKQKNEFWLKLRHKSDCCCFGWAVYAPWACYMEIRALYTTKPPKCALTCLGDLAADHLDLLFIFLYSELCSMALGCDLSQG